MPRKYDDEDDDFDDVPVRKKELSGMDAFFGNTNMVVLVLFSLCCGGIALIVSIIGVFTCTDAKAKANAKTVMIISIIVTALGVCANIISFAMQSQQGFR